MVVVSLLLVSSLTALAVNVLPAKKDIPTVTLENKGNDNVGFTFNRENKDLFDNFKNLVPGDKITQKITVKSDVSKIAGGSNFKVYLYAVNGKSGKIASEEKAPEDLFSQFKITVMKDSKPIVLDSALNDNKGALLGEFRPDDKQELDVQIEVPKELGNEYQDCIGEVEWHFCAQQVAEPEKVVDIPVVDIPKTGSDQSVFGYGIVAFVSLCSLVVLNRARRNKKKE